MAENEAEAQVEETVTDKTGLENLKVLENIEVKLQEQEIIYGNKTFKFELDSFKKKCLLEGLDDIALSLEKTKNIESFENKMSQNRPWL